LRSSLAQLVGLALRAARMLALQGAVLLLTDADEQGAQRLAG